MSLAHVIQQHLDLLPPSQQAEVLDFVLFLEYKQQNTRNVRKNAPFRQPPPIAAQVQIIGNIFESIPADDWDLPT